MKQSLKGFFVGLLSIIFFASIAHAFTILPVNQGGTGIGTIPNLFQLLEGGPSSSYRVTSTPRFVAGNYYSTSTASNQVASIFLTDQLTTVSTTPGSELARNAHFVTFSDLNTPTSWATGTLGVNFGMGGPTTGGSTVIYQTSTCATGSLCAENDTVNGTTGGDGWLADFSQDFTYDPTQQYTGSFVAKGDNFVQGMMGPGNSVCDLFTTAPLSDFLNSGGMTATGEIWEASNPTPSWVPFDGFDSVGSSLNCAPSTTTAFQDVPWVGPNVTGDAGTTTVYFNLLTIVSNAPSDVNHVVINNVDYGIATSTVTTVTGTNQWNFNSPDNRHPVTFTNPTHDASVLINETSTMFNSSTFEVNGQGVNGYAAAIIGNGLVTGELTVNNTTTVNNFVCTGTGCPATSTQPFFNPNAYYEADGVTQTFSWDDPSLLFPDAVFGYDTSSQQAVIYGGATGGQPGNISFRYKNPSLGQAQQEAFEIDPSGSQAAAIRFGLGSNPIHAIDFQTSGGADLFDLNDANFSELYGGLIVSSTLVVGTQSINNGQNAAVIGNSDTMSGANSLIVGQGNTVTNSAFSSITAGAGNTINGSNDAAFGQNNSLGGQNQLAGGYGNQIIQNDSWALGNSNYSNAFNGGAFGTENYVSGNQAMAFGLSNTSTGQEALAFGTMADVEADNSVLYNLDFSHPVKVSNNQVFSIMGGNVGIGTTTPASRLVVEAGNNGQIAVVGDETNSSIDYHNSSTPFGQPGWWQVGVGAGSSPTTSFDYYSSNMGGDVMTLGYTGYVGIDTTSPFVPLTVIGSASFGGYNDVLNSENISSGNSNDVQGADGGSFGVLNQQNGNNSFDFGLRNNADGPQAFAVGNLNNSTGQNSFATGSSTSATGDQSFTGGEGSSASGLDSFAFGNNAQANAPYTTAFGNGAEATITDATAFGPAMTVNGVGSFGISLGGGAQTLTQGSTFAVLGGSVGIGTNTPSTVLSVVGTSTLQDTIPSADETYALGTWAKKWNNFYSLNFNVGNVSSVGPAITFDNTLNSGQFSFFNGVYDTAGSDNTALAMMRTNTPYTGDMEIATGGDLVLNPGTGTLTSTAFAKNLLLVSGNFGIGTTTPQNPLTVIGNASIGGINSVFGIDNMAVGDVNSVTGTDNAAFGQDNTANNSYDFAAGEQNTVSGNAAFAAGVNTIASGDDSVALGSGSHASGPASFAAGSSVASGQYAASFGLCTASGFESMCTGQGNTASGDFSLAFGVGDSATGSVSMAFGQNMRVGTGEDEIGFSLTSNPFTHYSLSQTSTMAIMGGNVGIGTTTPNSILTVVGTSTLSNLILSDVLPPTSSLPAILNIITQNSSPIVFDRYGGAPPNIIFRRANGTEAAPTNVTTDNQLFAIGGRGFGSTIFSGSSRAAIFGAAAESWTDTAQGAYLAFNTTPIGTSTTIERLRITASGNVGIGTTTPSKALDVVGEIRSSATSTASCFTTDGVTCIGGISLSGTNIWSGLNTFNATTTLATTTVNGELNLEWGTPTLSSCGTSPSISGNNHVGTVTIGGGISVTACTINFVPNFVSSSKCIAEGINTFTGFDVTAQSSSSVTFGLSVSLAGGQFNYQCFE